MKKNVGMLIRRNNILGKIRFLDYSDLMGVKIRHAIKVVYTLKQTYKQTHYIFFASSESKNLS